MIYKIVCFFLLPMLFLALFLSLAGVQQINLGDSYYEFMSSVIGSFNNWKFEIPTIPKIPSLEIGSASTDGGILEVLKSIVNFFVLILNGFVLTLNVGIVVVNVLVQVVQFILTIVYQCKDFIVKVSPNVV